VGIDRFGMPTGMGRAGQAGAGLDEILMGGSGSEFWVHYIRSG
jgi:hypothetical protein